MQKISNRILDQYIDDDGLGLMSQKDRIGHLRSVLRTRAEWYMEMGFDRRRALKAASMGFASDGGPNLEYRGAKGITGMFSLSEPEPFKFKNRLTHVEAQSVIDDYLERYPNPRIYK